MPENSVLSYRTWLAYGVGHVLNDLCSSIWFTYTLLFFDSVLQFGSTLAGVAIVIGQIADGISTPIVGLLSDKNAQNCKYGRRKIWHLIGTVCVFCSFPFIFSPYFIFQKLTTFEQLIYYSFFIIVFQFGWASTQISHLSLVPDLTTHQHERTSLFAIRYTFTVLSSIIVYVIFYMVLSLGGGMNNEVLGPQDLRRFQLLAGIIVVIGGITSSIFHFGVVEKHHTENDSEQLINHTSTSRRTSLFCDTNLHIVAFVYVSTRLFCNLSQIYIPYYIEGYLKLPSKDLAILPLAMFASSFITSMIIKEINVEFGRKVTFMIGVLIGIGACLWVHFGQDNDKLYGTYEIYGVVIAFGCASTVLLVTSLGIVADLIGDDANNGAFIYGLMSFADKVSNGVVVLVIQSLFEDVKYSKYYYRDALALSGIISATVGSLAVLSMKYSARELIRISEEDDAVRENSHVEDNPRIL